MNGFEIAIVGMAGRFPGARSVAELWRNLRDGVESVVTFTDEELLAGGEDPARLTDPLYVRRGAVLDGIEEFDAGFFGITPREAEITDPQHRLFLQTAWEALESAGCDPARFPGPIGVYGGASSNTYLIENLLANDGVETGSLPALFGNQTDYLTTRVSYKLNLRGPSLDVQTSCSSSLVAVHLACQALLSGECDLALAGGVSITVPHRRGYLYQEQGIYSPDGHCRAFSKDARGTVGGNGVAIVALKRLQDALDDGDSIRAVVLGSAINNDGSGKVGYSAPSVEGQTAVVRNALAMADVEADTVGYVETHGTGTSLGDPIEIAALTDAFRATSARTGFCAIGSIKTNIGHLDTAAGVTGLIKAALAIQHRELPPSLNCDEPDPKIDFPSTPFRVNTALTPWEVDGPRRAGVSSFGIGGTNAHVIVGEAPAAEPSPAAAPKDAQLVVFSARTPAALERATEDLARDLREHPGRDLADVAWTLQTGRADFAHRRTVLGRDAADVAAALEASDRERVRTFFQETADRSVVFAFPGQGAQYVRMGAGLYEGDAVFREHLDRAAEILRPHLGLDLRDVLYPAPERAEAATEELRQTALTQPALFAVEHALAQRFLAWGVRPTALIGHSIGEYVAATLAGVFDLEQALGLVCARGRLMQDLPSGSMLAVPLPAAELEPLLGVDLALAAVNEPSSSVASGSHEAVRALEETLAARGVECRPLHTSHAFHSPMMDPILEPFTELVRAAAPRAPEIPFVSNVTGTWIRAEEAQDPAYWATHLRRTVRFADGIATLLDEPRALLEVGPGNTLTTLSSRIARRQGAEPATVAAMRHPRDERPDRDVLADALGQLWLARIPADWQAVHGGAARRRVPLPTYAFDRQRYWIEPSPGDGRARRSRGKRPDVADWFWVPSWRRSASPLLRAPRPTASEVLVFADRDELGEELQDRLRALGTEVTTVRPGSAFAVRSDREFAVRPGVAADYSALFAALAERGRAPEHALHLWCLEPPDTGAESAELDRGLYSLLFLAQAAESAAPDREEPLRLTAFLRDVSSVTGDELLEPERAAALGVCQSIAQECAHVACRAVDVDREAARAAGVDALLAELEDDSGDASVAWRGRHRWVRGYEPVRIEGARDGDLPHNLRERGHYLVTGGLGSIGLEVAACLARAARARLVLAGRSGLPARDDWEAWCAGHPEDDETRRQIEQVLALEEAGAEVLVLRADVTDRDGLRALLERAEERFGPLNGVVHAAGAEKLMTLFGETDRATCETQLAPKLAGLRVLEEALADRELDFCVVQSSLSSVLGVLAMVGYAAAHCAVDAFVARHNRAHAQAWTSANWDNWLSWKEPEFEHGAGDEALFMTPAEGAQAFERVVGLPPGTQVVVSTGDLEARIEQWSRPAGETRAAEQNLHARPELASDYVAPESPAEEALARAWSEILGIGQIGVHDSFFELGGDSVLGLQVVAKVSQAGFRITPAQIFEHPTIRELAAAAATGATQAEQGRATGTAPLLPIQHWFFEQQIPDPQHFNMPMLLEVGADVDTAAVERALADVLEHHDALRLCYRPSDTADAGSAGVEQHHAADADAVEVTVFDLAGVPAADRTAAMAERATGLHTSLDLAAGPLTRAGLFRFGPSQPAQLVWIVHHLLVDAVSWRTLAEDFGTALAARRTGAEPELPPKTTSFQQWARALEEHAQSDALRAELDGWLALASSDAPPLPVDSSDGENVFSSARTVSVALEAETTRALLQDVPAVYGTHTDEVLLTALVRACADWTGSSELLVDLEGHGRGDLDDDLDLSRTVGWFTTLYPARLSLAGIEAPGEALKALKEQLRGIPRHGLGYGELRYLSRDSAVREALGALPQPALNFLYLGQFDTGGESGPMGLMQAAGGPPCSPLVGRLHLLEIVAYVAGGRLAVDWSYSEARHARATVEALAQSFQRELEALVAHCQAPEAGGHTPSDFPAAKVKQSDLDKLLTKIGKPAKIGKPGAKGSGPGSGSRG